MYVCIWLANVHVHVYVHVRQTGSTDQSRSYVQVREGGRDGKWGERRRKEGRKGGGWAKRRIGTSESVYRARNYW